MNKQVNKLPDAERDVLACLTRLESATVRELQDELTAVRVLDASSVLTLLNRLEGKRLVSKKKADKGKAFVFRPTAASRRAYKQLMNDLVSSVFAGDTVAFMSSFLETQKPTEAEIEQLQQLLSELRATKQKKKGNSK